MRTFGIFMLFGFLSGCASMGLGGFCREATLTASTTCTKRECLPPNTCCNQCLFSYWSTDGLVAYDQKNTLPTCQPNGCGVCEEKLKACGFDERKNGNFRVVKWELVGRSLGL